MSYKLIVRDMRNTESDNALDSFSAPAHNTHSKTISPTAFEKCRPSCMLEVLVTPKSLNITDSDNQKISRTIDYDDTFSIVVSQKFLDIQAG